MVVSAVAREAVVMPHSTAGSRAGHHLHDRRVEAGLLRHHLPQDGVQPLPHLGVAGEHQQAPVRLHPDRHPADVVHAVADAGVLDAAGDPGERAPT